MANQTISAVTRNFDDAAISGLVNSDGITVNNGGTLIMDADTRWAQRPCQVKAQGPAR